ncbi:glycoside hydrolase family 9 protein [Sphingomonas sp.]|uniref:glycoside hydrolase family 9 protein n=1 Tax=Sphingomonas sp. TaxID=28214 RepID=UPI0035C7AA2E
MTLRSRLLRCSVLAAAATITSAGAAADGQRVFANQVSYETRGLKIAIVRSDEKMPIAWTLENGNGREVARGSTIVVGFDATAGLSLHRIDFSGVRTTGSGYRIRAGGGESHPFALSDHPFSPLTRAATSFFYQQRSAVPVERRYVERADLARPAGHPREIVTCFAGTDQRGVRWPGCDYQIDATGGWYDAGDHGKYVVNGGIAAWTLLDLHQRLAALGARDVFADGRLSLPEAGNGVDDLLDEARVEVSFLLAMQLPDGQHLPVATNVTGQAPASGFQHIDAGGLVHSKVADAAWTGLPTAPADDRQPRFAYPPTTAATLNMAAVAAQAARIWRRIDPAFAARADAAARRAWAAAARHPALFASSDFAGSGGYGDMTLDDERFWASAELYAATRDARYGAALDGSRYFDDVGDLSWGDTALAGLMTLAALPAGSGDPLVARARRTLLRKADAYVADVARAGFAIPMAGTAYQWGSNAALLNRALVLGAAWQVEQRPGYRAAMIDVLDYLLGRNPLDQSYVSGFGARPMRHPHHRFWAHQADARYPYPPAGVLSGGPNNTAMSDDVAKTMKGKCAPQQCWVDDYRAFTMNEVAINWNAPLVWVAAFLDATAAR